MTRWPIPRPDLRDPAIAGATPPDDYFDKIAKYVPAEALAPAVAAAGLAKDQSDTVLWIIWAIAFIVGFGFILKRVNSRKPGEPEPAIWFWPLMIIAFIVWSVGASEEFRHLLNFTTTGGKIVLVVGAFAIPGIDQTLEEIRTAWRRSHSKA